MGRGIYLLDNDPRSICSTGREGNGQVPRGSVYRDKIPRYCGKSGRLDRDCHNVSRAIDSVGNRVEVAGMDGIAVCPVIFEGHLVPLRRKRVEAYPARSQGECVTVCHCDWGTKLGTPEEVTAGRGTPDRDIGQGAAIGNGP